MNIEKLNKLSYNLFVDYYNNIYNSKELINYINIFSNVQNFIQIKSNSICLKLSSIVDNDMFNKNNKNINLDNINNNYSTKKLEKSSANFYLNHNITNSFFNSINSCNKMPLIGLISFFKIIQKIDISVNKAIKMIIDYNKMIPNIIRKSIWNKLKDCDYNYYNNDNYINFNIFNKLNNEEKHYLTVDSSLLLSILTDPNKNCIYNLKTWENSQDIDNCSINDVYFNSSNCTLNKNYKLLEDYVLKSLNIAIDEGCRYLEFECIDGVNEPIIGAQKQNNTNISCTSTKKNLSNNLNLSFKKLNLRKSTYRKCSIDYSFNKTTERGLSNNFNSFSNIINLDKNLNNYKSDKDIVLINSINLNRDKQIDEGTYL